MITKKKPKEIEILREGESNANSIRVARAPGDLDNPENDY